MDDEVERETETRLDLDDLRALDRLLDAMGTDLATRSERRVRRRPWAVWSGAGLLAAAAAAALVIVGPFGATDDEPLSEGGAAPAAFDEGLDVEASGPFVVFPTSNENITVIWLLED